VDHDAFDWLLARCGASRVVRVEHVQSLWSGYGSIQRVHLAGGGPPSVIVKHVKPPEARPGDVSHARKLRSYEVEATFYRAFASRCGARVATLIAERSEGRERWIALEDLDAAGFARRSRDPSGADLDACVAWLAALHGPFVGTPPEGMWDEGSYWQLDTRRDELAATGSASLARRAETLHARLRQTRHRTILHGDPKPANFCFASRGPRVAAVDFQYAGGGAGMRDLAYLLHRTGSARAIARGVDLYFEHLASALPRDVDRHTLEDEWRPLFDVAVEDFERFLVGWRG
jgi:aminoglycoside phosphotransferase (APT) family kinase protein